MADQYMATVVPSSRYQLTTAEAWGMRLGSNTTNSPSNNAWVSDAFWLFLLVVCFFINGVHWRNMNVNHANSVVCLLFKMSSSFSSRIAWIVSGNWCIVWWKVSTIAVNLTRVYQVPCHFVSIIFFQLKNYYFCLTMDCLTKRLPTWWPPSIFGYQLQIVVPQATIWSHGKPCECCYIA